MAMNHPIPPDSGPSLHAAIDIGTTAIKCIAVSSASPELVQTIGSMPTALIRGARGSAEVDPEAVLDACIALLEKLHVHSRRFNGFIATIGLTGFVGSAICIDEQGRPLPPCAISHDQRCTAQSRQFFDAPPKRIRQIHGIELPEGDCWPGPKIRWLADNHPEVLLKTWKVLQVKDYVFFHLTGLVYSEARTFIGLANIVEKKFDPEAVAWCGIRPDQLPELREAEEAFPLHKRWRRLIDDEKQLPLVGIGTADTTAAFLACSLSPGEAALLANTSEIIGLGVESKDSQTTSKGVVRVPYRTGVDLVYGSTTNGGASIDWFQQVFGPADLDVLSVEAAKIPPGSDGLFFLPYLRGERAPLWNSSLTGAFTGMRSTHTKAHFYRAVLEGCSFSKRHVLQTADPAKYGGVHRLKICGGSARVPLWNQIRASVLNLPVELRECPECSALGALKLAMGNAIPCCANATGKAAAVVPNPSWIDAYERTYAGYLELISKTQE